MNNDQFWTDFAETGHLYHWALLYHKINYLKFDCKFNLKNTITCFVNNAWYATEPNQESVHKLI